MAADRGGVMDRVVPAHRRGESAAGVLTDAADTVAAKHGGSLKSHCETPRGAAGRSEEGMRCIPSRSSHAACVGRTVVYAYLLVQPTMGLFVMVTAPVAKARPVRVVSVRVMAPPPRIVPWNAEVESVTSLRTHHVTLHGVLPTTVKPVAVRAPVPLVPISNNQGPAPSRVRVPVNVAAASCWRDVVSFGGSGRLIRSYEVR
jgi:hypothetical protein